VTTERTSTTQTPQPKTTPADTATTAPALRIYVRGGKIDDEKFYIVEPEKDARDLKNVEQLLRERLEKKPGKPVLRELIIVLNDDQSAGYRSQAVLKLDAAAKLFGLSVGYDPPEKK
jgi:hypothetical protein